MKGRTENALLQLPFAAAYRFRPGVIQPQNGIRSKTGWSQALDTVLAPLYPLLQAIGLAGAPTRILDSFAINAVAAAVHG